MKRLLTSIVISLLTLGAYAQGTQSSIDSLNSALSSRIEGIESSINELRQNQTKLGGRIEKANQEISSIKGDLTAVGSKASNNENAISDLDESVSSRLNEATSSYQQGQDSLSSSMQSRSLVGCLIAILLALLAIVVYLLLRKRIANSADAVESIRAAQKDLQEESLKLDNKLLEIFDTQLKVQKETSANAKAEEMDHSLALKVADELTRIETNLSRMDSNVRGYKQLSASLRRIKDNYLANGYEIVDMLGKPYNDGMKVIANFVPDENLKEGEQIITGIVKPQINYKGQMIQAAQITVSQN